MWRCCFLTNLGHDENIINLTTIEGLHTMHGNNLLQVCKALQTLLIKMQVWLKLVFDNDVLGTKNALNIIIWQTVHCLLWENMYGRMFMILHPHRLVVNIIWPHCLVDILEQCEFSCMLLQVNKDEENSEVIDMTYMKLWRIMQRLSSGSNKFNRWINIKFLRRWCLWYFVGCQENDHLFLVSDVWLFLIFNVLQCKLSTTIHLLCYRRHTNSSWIS